MKKKMKKSSKDVGSNLPDYDKRPCFFRIILPGKPNHSLEIPSDFVKTYLPEAMPCKAVLKGPSGECWNIIMWKEGQKASMQRGWQLFYQDHCLGNEEFLCFRYNGNMCFDVQVFDKSGQEIKYGSITQTHQHSTPEIKEEEMDIDDVLDIEAIAKFTKKARSKTREGINPASSSRNQPVGRKPKANVCKAAEDFSSKFPHFKQCLTKSNVEHPFQLRIPTHFLAHLPEGRTEFSFYTAKQKSWKVMFREINKVSSKGWRRFAIDNKLKIFDSCVFELVAPANFRVHIFPQ